MQWTVAWHTPGWFLLLFESLVVLQRASGHNCSHSWERNPTLHVCTVSLSLCCCRLSAVLTINTVVPAATPVTYQQELATRIRIPCPGMHWLWMMWIRWISSLQYTRWIVPEESRPALMIAHAAHCHRETMDAVRCLRLIFSPDL